MKSVFLVQHEHHLPSGEESVKLIGVYRTLSAAEAAIARLASRPGFSQNPKVIDPSLVDEEQGFYISEIELDKDHWMEGFVTMAGNEEYKL